VYVEGQLQTRKYTDQAGAEKYTTEVVLQRFRGELALLDSRGSGDSAAGGGGWQDDFGQSAPLDRPSGNRPQERNSFSRDLDDEVPF
jgi:single-strand DNA-binding protein